MISRMSARIGDAKSSVSAPVRLPATVPVPARAPGGRLAVFWNAFGFPLALREAFGAAYRRAFPGSPVGGIFARPAVEVYLSMCATAADGMRSAGGFGEPEQWRFEWERPYTRDEWLDVVPTFGGQSQLPASVLGAVLADMGAAIDAAGGGFTMSYTTVAATASRLARNEKENCSGT